MRATISRYMKSAACSVVALCLAAPMPAMSQTAPAAPQELNVVVASSSMIYPALWLALADNMFEKNNLKVNVTNNAVSTGAAMLVSGRADIFVTNALAGLRIAKEGKKVSYIWNFSYVDATILGFVTRPGITSMSQLAGMGSGCNIVSLPPGSAHYAYLQGVMKSFKLGCSISTVATMPLLTAGVSSSQFDGAPMLPMDAQVLVGADKAKLQIDPENMTEEQKKAIYPFSHPVGAAFGMTSNLEGKRDAVVLFLKTLKQANKILLEIDSKELVSKLTKLTDVFATTTPASLELQWRLEKPLVPTGENAGELRQSDWPDLLTAASTVWNLAGLSPTEPSVQYNEVVDMSYFKAAK